MYTFCINVCEYQISTSFNLTVRQTRFEKFKNPSFLIRNVIANFINILHFLDKRYVRIRQRTPFLLYLSSQLSLLLWMLLEALQIPWYSEANMRQIAILNHPELSLWCILWSKLIQMAVWVSAMCWKSLDYHFPLHVHSKENWIEICLITKIRRITIHIAHKKYS